MKSKTQDNSLVYIQSSEECNEGIVASSGNCSTFAFDPIELAKSGIPFSYSETKTEKMSTDGTSEVSLTRNLSFNPISNLNSKEVTDKNQNDELTEEQNKIFDDRIYSELIQIYQAADSKRCNPPTQEQMAEHLHKKGLSETVLTKQAISNRVKKLKKMGLIGLQEDYRDPALRHKPSDLANREKEIKIKF